MLEGLLYERTRYVGEQRTVHLTRDHGETTLCGLIAYAEEFMLRERRTADCKKCLTHHEHYVEEDEIPRADGYVYVMPAYGAQRRHSHYVIGQEEQTLCGHTSPGALRCFRASMTNKATCQHCRSSKTLDVDDQDLNQFFEPDIHARMNQRRGGPRRRSWDRS